MKPNCTLVKDSNLYGTETSSAGGILMRACACGNHAVGGECEKCKLRHESQSGMLQRVTPTHAFSRDRKESGVPPIVHEVLHSPGQPLDAQTRAFMEPRFGRDFSGVRLHMDGRAAESAQAVNALAYTVGKHVAFGAGRYTPGTSAGDKLIAHELAHVSQQTAAHDGVLGDLSLGEVNDAFENEADRAAEAVTTRPASQRETRNTVTVPGARLQRQFITPLGQGGGFGGLMDRDRRRVAEEATAEPLVGASSTGSPYQVCARDLQGVLGYIGNHAYIDAPPFRYAIISPLCPASWSDNPITGTTAQKWDNSPDPCGKTPRCIDCQPAPGVTDLAQCFRDTFNAYNNPSLYRGTGPNSNTFAGTLARRCCAGMVPKPGILGNVPGWDDSPAPARTGATPCPPGPSCS